MKTVAKSTATPVETRARRAAAARRRRLEDKIDLERARKELALIDSGKAKPRPLKEVMREMVG